MSAVSVQTQHQSTSVPSRNFDPSLVSLVASVAIAQVMAHGSSQRQVSATLGSNEKVESVATTLSSQKSGSATPMELFAAAQKRAQIEREIERDVAAQLKEIDVAPELREIMGENGTNANFLKILYRWLELMVDNMELERMERKGERDQYIAHIKLVCENYKSQGKWLLATGIIAGVCGMVGAASIVVGHVRGESIVKYLGTIFPSIKDMEPSKLFKSIAQMCHTMVEMNKMAGQTQQAFAESGRTDFQSKAEMNKTDESENTRRRDDHSQSKRSRESLVSELLRMWWETWRSILSS